MELKRDLDYQYQQWQDQINSRNLDIRDVFECRRQNQRYVNNIEFHRDRLEVLVLSSELEADKQEFKLLIEELEQFQVELNVNFENFREYADRLHDQILRLYDEKPQGLTAQRIQQFEQFQADKSFLGDQCVICMGNIEVDRNMMRLDCDGQHNFCQVCIEGWFANHKTCPICRHPF